MTIFFKALTIVKLWVGIHEKNMPIDCVIYLHVLCMLL